jgi:hypothetical protein
VQESYGVYLADGMLRIEMKHVILGPLVHRNNDIEGIPGKAGTGFQ